MSHASICALLSGLVAGMWAVVGNATTFELARRADGIVVEGIKVEGEIVPGDAQKLLDFYGKYGDLDPFPFRLTIACMTEVGRAFGWREQRQSLADACRQPAQ